MASVVKTENTPKGKKQTLSNGAVVYSGRKGAPGYKGSKQNKNRPISAIVKPGQTSATSSQNTAAYEQMKSRGKAGSPVPKGMHTAHKGKQTNAAGNKRVSASSTTLQKASKNIGHGNQNRKPRSK